MNDPVFKFYLFNIINIGCQRGWHEIEMQCYWKAAINRLTIESVTGTRNFQFAKGAIKIRLDFSPWKTRRRTTERNNPPPRWASNWWRPRHSFRDSFRNPLSAPYRPCFLRESHGDVYGRGGRSRPLAPRRWSLPSPLKPGRSRLRHLLRERGS